MLKPLPKQTLRPPTPKTGVAKVLPIELKRSVLLGDDIFWDLDKVPNPHMVILGTSGSGKTQTLKAIVSELFRSAPSQSIVLDFHGDQKLPGEIYFPLNMSSKHGINPLRVNLDPEGGGPKLQAIAVAASLRRSLQLGVNQEGLLILTLEDVYGSKGITQANYQS